MSGAIDNGNRRAFANAMHSGVSKREYFAAMALQGIITANVPMKGSTEKTVGEDLGRLAVFFADALLAALEVQS